MHLLASQKPFGIAIRGSKPGHRAMVASRSLAGRIVSLGSLAKRQQSLRSSDPHNQQVSFVHELYTRHLLHLNSFAWEAPITRPSRHLSKAFAAFSERTPIPVCSVQQFLLRRHSIFLYDGPHVTKWARVYTGRLVPQPASHDHFPRLLASRRTACWSPE